MISLFIPSVVTGLLSALSKADFGTTCHKKASPPPPPVFCNLRGTNIGTNFVTKQFGDLETCAKYCSDISTKQSDPECAFIVYDDTTKLCTFLSENARSHILEEGVNGSSTISDLACFSCTFSDCKNPPSPSVNLFDNPNFNISYQFGPWVSSNSHLVRYTKDSKAVILTAPSTFSNFFSTDLNQNLPLCVGEDYEVSFYLKMDQFGTPPKNPPDPNDAVYFVWFAGDCEVSRTLAYNDTYLGTWHRQYCSFRRYSLDDEYGRFRFYVVDDDQSQSVNYTVTLANFKLSRRSPDSVKVKGRSLVVNGGFESKRIQPWEPNESSDPRYTTRTTRCKTKQHPDGAPYFNVVTPGLPKSSLTPSSNYAFYFCGVAGVGKSGAYDDEVKFQIQQRIHNANISPDKRYVLTLQYQAFNSTINGRYIDPQISIGYYSWNYAEFNDKSVRQGNPHVFQRLVMGSDLTTSPILSLVWTAIGTARGGYYDPYPNITFPELRVFLDNVSLYEVDE